MKSLNYFLFFILTTITQVKAEPVPHEWIEESAAKVGLTALREFTEKLSHLHCREILILPVVRSVGVDKMNTNDGKKEYAKELTSDTMAMLSTPELVNEFIAFLSNPTKVTMLFQCDVEYRILPVAAGVARDVPCPTLLLLKDSVVLRFATDKAPPVDVIYRGEFPKWIRSKMIRAKQQN